MVGGEKKKSLVSKKTLQNIETKWIKEVQTHCPGTPCILVGLKSDLKNHFDENQIQTNQDKLPVSAEDIQRMKEKINAKYYFECSSKNKINFNVIFTNIEYYIEISNKIFLKIKFHFMTW